MRASKRVLGGLLLALLGASAAVAHGCGKDPDTPTPTRKVYPQDEIDALATNERVVLPALSEPVRVVRDARGMVHVYARDAHDAGLAQGYMMAHDRAPQLELLRRVAEGRLAEVFGNLDPSIRSRDVAMRMIGLRRVAEKMYAQMAPGSYEKDLVDGFAQGITAFFRQIRSGDAKRIPNGWTVIPKDKYADWDPAATLAIARLNSFNLSDTSGDEIELDEMFQKAHETFRADASDPARKARAGFVLDALRFEPAAKRPVLDGPPPAAPAFFSGGLDGLGAKPFAPTIAPRPRLSSELLASVRPAVQALRASREAFGKYGWNSNNWVVSPAKSATGKVLVASDPHLPLPAPSIFYMAGIHVLSDDPSKRVDVAGMSFAGIPGIVLGFNERIAWGATVAGYDVNDVYRDVITDGKVTLKGPDGASKQVEVERIEETIDYGDGKPQTIVIEAIPGHGVVFPTIVNDRWVPRETSEVLAMRHTSMEPSRELEAFMGVNRAKTVDEAVAAMKHFDVGAQNFVFGDVDGNIAYTTHAHVPIRPSAALAWDASTGKGQLPCLVLPGDQGLEWSGRVPAEMLPQTKNPKTGYVATANSDQYGLVFDNDPSNDPMYLSCAWDPGYRQARLRQRLDAKDALTPADMASIQADAKSPLGARVAPFLVKAIERAEAARTSGKSEPEIDALVADPRWDATRMQFVLAILKAWGATSDYDTPAAVPVGDDPIPNVDEVTASQATLVFNAAMVALHANVFDDEWSAMGEPPWFRDQKTKTLLRILEKPAPLATADASGESVLWDDLSTPEIETKDQQLLRSLLEGLDWIVKTYGANPDKWRWGSAHGIRFTSLLTGTEGQLSIPSFDSPYPDARFPRHGDEQVLDRSDYGLGRAGKSFSFTYSSGPAQRFVANMTSPAPEVRNALPGGNVWRPDDPFYSNESELWRKNANAPVVFTPGQVVAAAVERWDLVPF